MKTFIKFAALALCIIIIYSCAKEKQQKEPEKKEAAVEKPSGKGDLIKTNTWYQDCENILITTWDGIQAAHDYHQCLFQKGKLLTIPNLRPADSLIEQRLGPSITYELKPSPDQHIVHNLMVLMNGNTEASPYFTTYLNQSELDFLDAYHADRIYNLKHYIDTYGSDLILSQEDQELLSIYALLVDADQNYPTNFFGASNTVVTATGSGLSSYVNLGGSKAYQVNQKLYNGFLQGFRARYYIYYYMTLSDLQNS